MLGYEDLEPVERLVWDAFADGAPVDLRSGTPEEDDPARASGWAADRTVRAQMMASLLLRGAGDGPTGAVSALRLSGARITGQLDLSGAAVGHAVRLEGCAFDEPVLLRGSSTRSLELLGCRIPGLNGWLLQVDGNLFFEDSLINDRLTLTRAHITGELRLSGATLTAREPARVPDPSGATGAWALWAGGLVMDGGVFARHGFSSIGGLRLVGARLGGGLFMEGARIENPGGDALSGQDLSASTMILEKGFTAVGSVRLAGASIRSRLSFAGAVLGGSDIALDGVRLQAGDLELTPAEPIAGAVDLEGARVAVLHDNQHSWPADSRIDGFEYTAIRSDPGRPESVVRRLEWIAGLPGYAPQPYEQLAGWYRRIGHDDDARRVLLEKQRRRRRTLHPMGRLWGRVLDGTVGYGYRPWQAGLWLLGLALLGTAVFGSQTPLATQPGQGAPFHPLVYTLDLLIPIGGFGQRGAWYWTGATQYLTYGLIAAGWVLTTAVVSGVTRSLNRN